MGLGVGNLKKRVSVFGNRDPLNLENFLKAPCLISKLLRFVSDCHPLQHILALATLN